MKHNRFISLIRYDLYRGICLCWKWYLFFAVAVVLVGLSQTGEIHSWNSYIQETAKNNDLLLHYDSAAQGNPSLGNFLLKWFHGPNIIEREAIKNSTIRIPAEWVLIFFSYPILTIHYLVKDHEENGSKIMVSSGSRKNRWYSKCIWLFAHTTVYFGLILGVLSIISMFYGGLSVTPSSDLWESDVEISNGTACIGLTVGMSFIVCLCMGMLILLAELIVSSAAALTGSFGILIASVFFCNPFWIGNYGMVCRNIYFDNRGVSWQTGAGIGLWVSVVCVAAGAVYMQKKEYV